MGQLYDSANFYDEDGTYDVGPLPAIVAPTKSNLVRTLSAASVPQQSSERFPWEDPAPRSADVRMPADPADAHESIVRSRWESPLPKGNDMRLRFEAAAARESAARLRWAGVAAKSNIKRLHLDAAAAKLSAIVRLTWGAVAGKQAMTAIAWGVALAKQTDTRIPWAAAAARNATVRLRWRPGYPYRSGYSLPFAGEPDPPPPGTPGSTIIIPPSDVYFMIPALSILRDSDAADLLAIDASLKLDQSSYSWTLDATIPRQTLSLVDPNTNSEPVLVDVTINGYAWKFIIESYQDNRKFGGTGCKIKGRGQQALLGAPYAPLTTYTSSTAEDASQLAADLMPGGWSVAWSTQDWLVPAGFFSYADLAPIDALAQLVNAIGGTIVPDPSALSMTVNPLYPTSPWNWGAPSPAGAVASTWAAVHTYAAGAVLIPVVPNGNNYVVITGGVSDTTEPIWPLDGSTVTNGSIVLQIAAVPYADVPASFIAELSGQWQGNFKTGYNGIYVSGQNGGIVGKVKRTGSAGDVLLPTVTDVLLCITAANTERGRIELAKADARKLETIRVPLLPPGGVGNPGVFPRDQLLQITEPAAWAPASWLGQVIAVQIDAVHSAAPGSALSVRQTLTIERHS